MNEARTYSVRDVSTGVYDGPHATPPPSDSGAIFLGIRNITEDGLLKLDNPRYISEEDLPKWTKRVTPREGDIVFSYEATLNLYAVIPEGFRGCLGRRMGLIRPNPEVVDGNFLYYYFFSPQWRKLIAQKTVIGSTVNRIPIETFPDFKLLLPCKPIQSRIAAVLSALDEKIKHNNELIKILEVQIQQVYDYWFMQFDFPDENGRPYRSSGGKMKWCEELKLEIPEGWKAATVRDYVKICNGKDHKAVGAGSIPCYGSGGYMLSVAAPIYEGESVLLPRKGTLNNVMLVNGAFWTVDTMFYTRPLSKGAAKYTYYSVRLYDLASMNLGTGVPSMTSTRLYDLKMVGADPVLLEEFDDIVEPMLRRVRKLREEITHLAAQRDFLLPRLMTGEITVAE